MTNTTEQNKASVLEAFDTLFNRWDYAAAQRFWSPDHIQHSALFEPGRDGLFNVTDGVFVPGAPGARFRGFYSGAVGVVVIWATNAEMRTLYPVGQRNRGHQAVEICSGCWRFPRSTDGLDRHGGEHPRISNCHRAADACPHRGCPSANGRMACRRRWRITVGSSPTGATSHAVAGGARALDVECDQVLGRCPQGG
jgi:hypothetical protein